MTSAALPSHIQIALANDPAALAGPRPDAQIQAALFRICAISASVNNKGWVDLLASWGMDLDEAPVLAGGSRAQNWLWNALARGKLSQAVALVRAGFTRIDVDEGGNSGLGVLMENTFHDHLPKTLETVELMQEAGLSWSSFPDALAFDAMLRKNVGSSLGELLAQRAHARLSQSTIQSACEHDHHRL